MQFPCKLCKCNDRSCDHCKQHERMIKLQKEVDAEDPEAMEFMAQGYANIIPCSECGGLFFTGDWWEQYCNGCYDLHWRPVHQVERMIYNRVFTYAVREDSIKRESLSHGQRFDATAREKLSQDIMELIKRAEEVKKVTGQYHDVLNEKEEPADISWIYKKKE